MDKLTKYLLKGILEENSKIKKVVGIYGGRFQPFGPHHYKTYQWLEKQVDEAYITTSNIKQPPRHPMNFKEKVRHMAQMGVPSNKIVQEKSPYVAKNLAKKFDEETTVFVYVFGAKDAGRLGGSGKYFQDYKKNKNNLKGHKHHGYYLVAPHVSISVGGEEVSGTSMRALLGSPKVDDSVREKLFKKMFGYFNKGIFQMMTNKFKKLFEVVTEVNIKKVLSKLKVPKTFIGDNVKLISYFQTNPQVLFQFLRLIGEDVDRKQINEFDVPIKVGDTVLMGKFKNKKVVIKSIDINEKGDLVINGKSASKFRIIPQVNIFETFDIAKIIKEASTSTTNIGGNNQGVDDGPRYFYGNKKTYQKRNEKLAGKLGWKVIRLLVGKNTPDVYGFDTDYPNGPIGDVSYAPTGASIKWDDRSEREHHTGKRAFRKYFNHINKVAGRLGYEILDYMGAELVSKHSLGTDEIDDARPKDTEDDRNEKEFKGQKVEESWGSKDWWKDLLIEGGAYGHMSHPFDDKDLTFGDLKQIITNGLGGQLNREDGVTEKLDGQNLMVSWIDGSLRIARNKGHIKNFGKTSLTASGIKSKFKGRGDIADAFNFAVKDLEKAIGSLSGKQQEKIFNNGQHWMNLEVMWPASANVVNYDVAQIVFHGALIYDDKGNVRGEVKGSARILAGMIQQVNQHIQKKYSIGKPNFLNVPKHQDFSKLKAGFLSRLDKLRNEFGLSDSDTLGMYHQSYWEEYIYNAAQQFGYNINDNILVNLTKRWAFFDKSYKIPTIRTDLKDQPKFLEWVLATDKNDHTKMVKENMKPFEILFFDVGAQILKNVEGYMSVSPDKAVQNMRKGISKAISDVSTGGDIKKIAKLKAQLEKLEAIGGMDAIVPSEGIVFKYQGKTYKFTGAFAPVNQIVGLITF